MNLEIFIGYDSAHPEAFAVAALSARQFAYKPRGIHLRTMREAGLYRRPTTVRASDGQLWDEISGAPMATEFAISRFLTPHLVQSSARLALFMDCDMLLRADPDELVEEIVCNSDFGQRALWCVQHEHQAGADVKMDGRSQTYYARKNWSSFMVFDLRHPATKRLTVEMVNELPGRDLHRFCWLDDEEIGAIYPGWNWLVGVQPEPEHLHNVHWTLGGPWLPEYADAPYADEWNTALETWVEKPCR